MFIVREYSVPENIAYEDNIFINFLPPLSPDSLWNVIKNPIPFDPNRRQHSIHLRIQYVMELLHYFIPTDGQIAIAWSIWTAICEGYRLNAPFKQSHQDAFEALVTAIRKDHGASYKPTNLLDSALVQVIIGTPGTGKTRTAKALCGRLAIGLIHHAKHGQLYQKLAIFIEPLKNSTPKQLAQQIVLELRSAAKETSHHLPLSEKLSENPIVLMDEIKVLTQKLNLGMLILDEIQHLFRGTSISDEETMKFLTQLINTINRPILLIGTWPCIAHLGLEGRLGRRSISPGSHFMRRMQNDTEWSDFFGDLMGYQYVLNPIDPSTEISEAFYFHCQGIHDLAIKLYVMTQIAAMYEGIETITADLVNRVAEEHMKAVAPWIKHMQTGGSEQNAPIADAEPTNFDTYIKHFRAKLELRRARTHRSTVSTGSDTSSAMYLIADALVAAEMISEDTALTLAQAALRTDSSCSVADHVAKIINDRKLKAPQPTKSKDPLKRKKVLDQFSALEVDDVRRITFLALSDGRDVQEALREKGFLCDLSVEFVS